MLRFVAHDVMFCKKRYHKSIWYAFLKWNIKCLQVQQNCQKSAHKNITQEILISSFDEKQIPWHIELIYWLKCWVQSNRWAKICFLSNCLWLSSGKMCLQDLICCQFIKHYLCKIVNVIIFVYRSEAEKIIKSHLIKIQILLNCVLESNFIWIRFSVWSHRVSFRTIHYPEQSQDPVEFGF